MIERRAIIFVLTVAAAYSAGLVIWLTHHPDLIGLDFAVYWRAAQGTPAEAYSAVWSNPFPYAPTMLLWVKPFGLMSFGFGYAAFMLASVAVFALATRPFLSPPQFIFALSVPPIVNGLSVGQCSLMLAGALLWAFRAQNRIMAGVVLGLVASIKPQLVLMAPVLLLLRRDWSAFWMAGIAWCVVVAVSVWALGFDAWAIWFRSLPNFHAILLSHNRLGMVLSPATAAQFLNLPAVPFEIIGALVGLWMVWTARRSPPVVQCAAVACGSVLSAPYAMMYDIAPAVPFLVAEVWAGSFVAAAAVTAVIAPATPILTAWRLTSQQLISWRRRPPVAAEKVRASLAVQVEGDV